MKIQIPRSTLWVVLTISLLAPATFGQTRRTSPQRRQQQPTRVIPKEPVPTFNTLLAADSYKLYVEIRSVGQLIRSSNVNDLLDPLLKFASPPKEVRTLVKWLDAHADELTTSRLLIASWPTQPDLPQFICAIEFATEDEAAKFSPQLDKFLPRILPTPSPSSSPTDPKQKSETATDVAGQANRPQYFLRHSGTLVLVSEKSFTFRGLRPANSKLLRDDEHFRLAHDRFNSEALFAYLDVKTEERSEPKAEFSARTTVTGPVAENQQVVPTSEPLPEPANTAEVTVSPEVEASTTASYPDAVPAEAGGNSEVPQAASPPPMWQLGNFLFGGQPRWPEAVALGLAFEPETYVIHALMINSEENKSVAIPFIPQLLSGPPIAPSASSIFPADTDVFVNASLDLVQMHDSIVKSAQREMEEDPQRLGKGTVPASAVASSPFEDYEKILGISLKKDLLPLLGNEVAFSLPMKSIFDSPPPPPQEETPESATDSKEPREEPAMVMAIALRDREGMKALLPKIVDSMGVKGASLLAQTERREDTELITYGNVLSYAFVGDFLVASTSTPAVRKLVDGYLNRQTLASSSNFHSFTRWQPRQLLGQVYVSTALSDSYEAYARGLNEIADEKLRDFVAGLTPATEPITYSLSNEGLGPMHELHLPRKLIMLMVAGMSSQSSQPPLARNESIAQGSLQMISSAQQSFKSGKGAGRFGSLQELIDEGLIPADAADRFGYRIELIASSDAFEAWATPTEYGKTGKRSYFIDQTFVLRAGDHGGGPATVADKPAR
jgi:hypothetical protein